MTFKKFHDFKLVNKLRSLNLSVQIILAILLFVGLNAVAFRHYYRWDVSANQSNTLSPESIAHLKNLKKPISIYMTMRPATGMAEQSVVEETQAIIKDISRLLNSYVYESDGKVSFEIIDPILNKKKGDMISNRFGSDIENSVIVACEDKSKKLILTDFYDIEDGKRINFKGEQAVSSAILSLSSDKQNKIYFLQGHGELKASGIDANSGLSEFTNALKFRGYAIDNLDLSAQKEIPSDADMLVIVSPRSLYLPKELDLIRKYLSKGKGRVVMFLGLGSISGLDDILFEWGIRADDMLIVDSQESESANGDMIARLYPQNPHAIIKHLVELSLPIQFGSARPVRQDMGAPIDPTLSLYTLIGSSPSGWAERGYRSETKYQYTPSSDIAGPIPIAMVAFRENRSDLGLNIGGGKLAVFGDEDFVTNSRFNSLGNSMLALNTINWMFDDNSALNVLPRKVERYVLVLSRGEMKELASRFSILPILVLVASLVTYIFRRR